MIPFQLHRRIPLLRRPFYQRDRAIAERDALADQLAAQRDRAIAEREALADQLTAQRDRAIAECEALAGQLAALVDFTDCDAGVLQYRQAFFEVHGQIAAGMALPQARPYPQHDTALSYQQRLISRLEVTGVGAEIGPLNVPTLSKATAPRLLYVDHLDTDGLRQKYPSLADLIVAIDRPMIDDSLERTLCADAPLDYVVASHVFEHVPNPIRWLAEIAAILRPGGLLAMGLPDRRLTFDFLRQESRASDIVAAFLADATVPDVRSVYDHHSQASFVNMAWASAESVLPGDVVAGRGAIKPKRATENYLGLARLAKQGTYLDVHAWVYTPTSFLLVMAQLAIDGFLPFRCLQFYPTDPASPDARASSSFVIIMEKADDDPAALRRSYLRPLGA